MTKEELLKSVIRLDRAERTALADIAASCRALIPVLKDRQMTETARELEAKLFVLDSVDQEQKALIEANTSAFLQILTERPGGTV